MGVKRYDRRAKTLAAGLSALAGFVDATGFISLGGFFVSFMSGNTTRMAVGIAAGTRSAAIAGGLIALFVLGVILGTLTGRFTPWHRAASVLMLVAVLLGLAALCGGAGFLPGAAMAMALAMGAENAVFERDGEVHIGLTYMTGTLVKLGQHLAAALTGGPPLGWTPYLLLWLGLASGAVLGAVIYPMLGLAALWLAAAAACAFAFAAARMGDFTRP
ncbi:MAG: hypothetical protein JWP16_1479 [Alphaproteobacteria bacterium]|nr:hypothetical protein [Alphaproteobacteria bacterium]